MNIREIRKARFKTAAEIEEAIDRKAGQIVRLRARAMRMYARANDIRAEWLTKDESDDRRIWMLKSAEIVEDGDKLVARASRLEAGRLAALKRKLAEFKTQLLPGFGEDPSIPKL